MQARRHWVPTMMFFCKSSTWPLGKLAAHIGPYLLRVYTFVCFDPRDPTTAVVPFFLGSEISNSVVPQ